MKYSFFFTKLFPSFDNRKKLSLNSFATLLIAGSSEDIVKLKLKDKIGQISYSMPNRIILITKYLSASQVRL